MKTASSDEELAFKQKERDISMLLGRVVTSASLLGTSALLVETRS